MRILTFLPIITLCFLCFRIGTAWGINLENAGKTNSSEYILAFCLAAGSWFVGWNSLLEIYNRVTKLIKSGKSQDEKAWEEI